MLTLKILASLVSVGVGIWSLLRPHQVAELSGFKLTGARGVAEMRTAFGGFFIGMGIGAILLNNPAAYQVTGLGWLGIAITRIAAGLVDWTAIDRSYIVIGVIEWVIALILIF